MAAQMTLFYGMYPMKTSLTETSSMEMKKKMDVVYHCSYLSLLDTTPQCETDLRGNVNPHRGTAPYVCCGKQWNNVNPL